MLNFRLKRILYRIIIPFTLLFGLTTISTWLFSAYFITRYLDQNLRQQMEQVAGIVSQSRYVLNPVIIRQLKEVINADIVLYGSDGHIYVSTFSDSSIPNTIKNVSGTLPSNPSESRDIRLGGKQYRTIIRPFTLKERGEAFLSLWMPTGEMDSLRRRIVFSIGGIALLGILAMTCVGYYIARSITSPVEELVRVTTRVSDGDFNERAHLNTDDEIGMLADSFNHMIDELKSIEERLVESEKLVTAGRMAAGLAHEIRNPLTSIKMLGQVLFRRMKEEPENRKMLESMVREIDRLDRIVQEMINRTRPGELRRQWGDVNRQLEDIITVAEEGITAGNIAINRNLSDHLPNIYMDHEKIKQVVWNLILNANEAMPGGGSLTISTDVVHDGSVEISIEDTGRGIAAGDEEHLFQPFFTTKPEGVGLGLTMSRKIIEKHGGTLILASRPEGGMKATIVLPTGAD